MATSRYSLETPPESARARELWLQHAAGFILFEDMRRYASDRIDPGASAEVRAAVQKGIDDAVYGLMMIIDGVSGALASDTERIELQVVVRQVRNENDAETVTATLNLADGDGMCMGYHHWVEGNFGEDPVARLNSK